MSTHDKCFIGFVIFSFLFFIGFVFFKSHSDKEIGIKTCADFPDPQRPYISVVSVEDRRYAVCEGDGGDLIIKLIWKKY